MNAQPTATHDCRVGALFSEMTRLIGAATDVLEDHGCDSHTQCVLHVLQVLGAMADAGRSITSGVQYRGDANSWTGLDTMLSDGRAA